MASVFPISSSWFSVVSPQSTNVTSKSSPSPSIRRRRFFHQLQHRQKRAATRWERSRFPGEQRPVGQGFFLPQLPQMAMAWEATETIFRETSAEKLSGFGGSRLLPLPQAETRAWAISRVESLSK